MKSGLYVKETETQPKPYIRLYNVHSRQANSKFGQSLNEFKGTIRRTKCLIYRYITFNNNQARFDTFTSALL